MTTKAGQSVEKLDICKNIFCCRMAVHRNDMTGLSLTAMIKKSKIFVKKEMMPRSILRGICCRKRKKTGELFYDLF